MGMQSRAEARLTLHAEIDESAVQKSVKNLRALEKAQRDVKKASDWAFQGMKKEISGLPPLNAELQKKIALLRKEIAAGQDRAKAIEKQTQALEKQAAQEEKVRQKQEQALAASKKQQTTAFGGGLGAIGTLSGAFGGGIGSTILGAASTFTQLKIQMDEMKEAAAEVAEQSGQSASGLSALGGGIGGLAAAGAAAIAMAALSIAIQKFIEDINKQQELLAAATDSRVKYYELVMTATQDEIQAEVERLEIKRRAVAATLSEVQAGIKAAESLDGFTGTLARLLGILGITTKDSKRLAEELQNIDMELRAYNDAVKSEEVQQRSLEQATMDTADALGSASKAADAHAKAVEEAKKKEEERARAIQQTARDIAQARLRESQAEAAAAQKRTQALQDIARKFLQASEDALADLVNDQADMAQKLGQEQYDIMLDAQREEAKAARDHVKTLKDIRQKAALDEFNAARDRDFARLVEIRRGVEESIDEESERFAAERKEANIALRQRLRDAKTAYMRERADRLLDYQRQLSDLRIAKRREQQEARINYQRDIALLRQALSNEIALKKQALQATLAATKAWAASMRSVFGGSTSGGSTVGKVPLNPYLKRATGGPLMAGQSAVVNERGSERYMSGGRTIALPAGMGLFTPFKSGIVQPAGDGIVVQQTVVAGPGMSEQRVANIAAARIKLTLKELVS